MEQSYVSVTLSILRPYHRFLNCADSPCNRPAVRYDAICYFNVRSKADISQLNLPQRPRGIKKLKTRNKEKQKSKKGCEK